MDPDVIDAEIWAEHSFQESPVEEIGKNEGDGSGEVQEDTETPFFVTISRHTGFRRLHKSGCCKTHPWACYKVEYFSRVVDGVADAICKTCKRTAGSALDEAETSSSGSSSSTDLDVEAATEEGNEPLG